MRAPSICAEASAFMFGRDAPIAEDRARLEACTVAAGHMQAFAARGSEIGRGCRANLGPRRESLGPRRESGVRRSGLQVLLPVRAVVAPIGESQLGSSRWVIACSAQPLPSGSLKKTKLPHGNTWMSLTSTPRSANSLRLASASSITICRPSRDPGAIWWAPEVSAIEQAEPGGVSCTKRSSSLTWWSWSAVEPTFST